MTDTTDKVTDAISIIKDLFEIGSAIADAASGKTPERVDAILPAEMRISIAKAAADLRAEKKFTGDGT